MKKALVAYFSASGVTEKLAVKLAHGTGADLFEIQAREPSIIDTFLEAYDFSGKQIVPFATSGSSGMGETGKNMEALASGAKVDAGKRFSSSASEEELTAWASRWL